MSTRLVVVHPDAAVLAEAAAARLLTRLLDLLAVRSPVHIVLTGGTIGGATLRAVAASPLRDAVDWTSVHLWWGDERYLDDGDAERNETLARDAVISHLAGLLPAENVHAVPAANAPDGRTAEDAARAYAATLAEHASAGAMSPAFDVVLLGMGPDAHVASLFPGHPALDAQGVAAVAVHDSPKPPADRVSLTFDALARAKEIWVVAAGAEKAPAVAAALGGRPTAEAPAGAVAGTERTLWLIDAAAAAELPGC